jgi:hypothetical protein
MTTPELRQFGTLEAEDFDRHPVWIGCHTADYGKPWYGQSDEETFRPWIGKLPVDPAEGIFLVRAVIQLRDGSRYPGFVTPAIEAKDGSAEERAHLLGTQQPHIFSGDRTFGFWGGMSGVAREAQQALYAMLGKNPQAIFPLRFSADHDLATGVTSGYVNGFYRRSSDGIQIGIAEPADDCEMAEATGTRAIFQMSARAWQGYPRPGSLTNPHVYKSVVYSDVCLRCGIHEKQGAPFRFAKSDQKEPSGFMQFNWVADSFFVRRDISQEIVNQGITGVSFGPALDHRTGNELTDRVQILLSTIIACVEASRLPTVTCRPENEEVVAFRKKFPPPQPLPSDHENKRVSRSPRMERLLRQARALPYCGRVKYHVPPSLALIPDMLKDAPDMFQTVEWFGSGAAAFRLTLASERFVKLVRERRWKGLVFDRVKQNGWSERTI